MSENTPESTPDATPAETVEPAPDTNINVGGDAVVNQAPDGGGVDNAAPEADAGTSADGAGGSD